MSGQTLPAAERIRRRPEFERVYSAGAKVHGRFMTVFVLPNGGPISRLGVAATRKIGSSVVRNRAKRLAREVFRRHKLAAGLDIVVVPRREMLDAPFVSLEADYHAVLQRSGRQSSSSSARRPRLGRHSQVAKGI
ncbi:MAG: ribonuclease P protein component [Acidobacteria bacterium]|nr:ribonuclease P protein component [Acidobacteriota bacterium]